MVGGVQAVTWTDVKQMVVIVAGVLAAVVMLIVGLPDHIGVGAGAAPRRHRRTAQSDRLPLRLASDLHVLVRPARRVCS